MDKENAFKKHKKAVIIIVVFLSISFLYNYGNTFPDGFGTSLRTTPSIIIGSLIANVIIFFVIFAIYYCFVQAFTKLRSKQVDKKKKQ